MSKSKAQGTAFETSLVNILNRRNIPAERIAEQGGNDPGDIHLIDATGDHWILEAKHREKLPIHSALHKAQTKVRNADLPYVTYGTAVIWKRSTLKDGNTRRTPDGTGIIVAIDLATFIDLLEQR